MSTWEEFYFERASLVAEMIGAGVALEEMGSSDEVVAETFRRFVERARAIEVPS